MSLRITAGARNGTDRQRVHVDFVEEPQHYQLIQKYIPCIFLTNGTEYMNDRLVFCCNHIFRKERRIKLVTFEPDGAIAYLCNEDDHEDDSFHGVCIGSIFDIEPDIRYLGKIRAGFEYVRQEDGTWHESVLIAEEEA